jgi:hypothetical protein
LGTTACQFDAGGGRKGSPVVAGGALSGR